MTTWTRVLLGGASALVLGLTAPALAQTPDAPQAILTGPAAEDPQSAPPEDQSPDSVIVFGRAFEQIGKAQSASEGVVGYADLSVRPISRAAELVEVIPGMIATEHSSGGKANQYFMRGFNLDHGTDFAGFIDGVPINQRSHPHMSGYLDLNFLMADLVERVEFKKGIQYAENGDYSAAGSASFVLYDRLPENYIGLRVDQEGEYRVSAAGSWDVGDGTLLIAASHDGGDGSFDLPAELDKNSAYIKYTRPVGNAVLRLDLIGYTNDWTATDQIPLRAVEDGTISRFGYIDPTNGGRSRRYIASAGLEWDNASLLGYLQKSELNLFHNFTYFIDPALGDQVEQVEDRTAAGARAKMLREFTLFGVQTTGRLGADIHMDWLDESSLYRTTARVRTSAISQNAVDVMLADVWGDLTFHWTDRVRTTFGLRADYLDGSVETPVAANAGSDSGVQWSPKINIAYQLTDNLEVYAGGGYGFHSNNIIGVVQTVDPVSLTPVDSPTLFSESRGGEIGMRWEPNDTFNLSGAVFMLDFDSELIYVGDAGISEPSDPTRRYGFELAAFWNPVDWLAFDASYAYSHSRFQDAPSDLDRVPNTIEGVAAAGVTWLPGDGWEGSLRVRYLGPGPLIEDNSIRSPSTTLVNAGISKDFGNFEIGLDVLNLLDAEAYDMVYFYESQLQTEVAPVEDIHFHPTHPRSFVLNLKAKY
ncbi:MAG TPA: TonB-dependent receptor [Dehalococcoidia bacterium]|nr:TonB-dependent receptor [Dehalococcoidia bacterium]